MELSKHPLVTVLLPVFNAGKHIRTSIKSILTQSFADFELLVIDDGSSDDTVAAIESFQDQRICLIKNAENMGVARTLNRGLDLARGKYVARMDADDISLPHRLIKQLKFMEQNPAVGISGTWVRYFGDQLPVIDRTPTGPEVVKAFLLFDNPLYHPSAILRKSLLDQFSLRYDSVYSRSEDYELWIRSAECFPLDNIPEPLLRFRCHSESVTCTASETMKKQACALLNSGLKRIDIRASDEELSFHYSISKGQRMESLEKLKKAEYWLGNMIRQNVQVGVYPHDAFLKAVGMIWFRLCYHSAHLGVSTWNMSKKSKIAVGYNPPIQARVPFMISLLINKILPGRIATPAVGD